MSLIFDGVFGQFPTLRIVFCRARLHLGPAR